MPGSTGPRLGFVWGYSAGETGWGLGGFNPNFAKLEALLHLSVTSITSTPPVTPAAGMVYIVGGSPTGAWAGHAGAVAAYYTTGWLFIAPVTGVRAWNVATATYWRYSGSAWVEEPASGNVSGPATSVAGAVPVYADGTGKLLTDSGIDFDSLLQIGAPLVPANFIAVDGVGRAIDSGVSIGGLGTGNVNGPLTSVTGNLASYADTSGAILADSGIPAADVILAGGVLVPDNLLTVDGSGDLIDTGVAVASVGDVTGPGSSVGGNIPAFADASGKVLADSGIPAADVILAGGALVPGNLVTANIGGDLIDTGVAVTSIGDVVGPAGAITGHLASYADATGELLADSAIPAATVAQTAGTLVNGHLLAADAAGKVVDSGVVAAGIGTGDVVGPASSTTGHLATYANATGKLLADGAIAASSVLLSGGPLGTPASGSAANLTSIPLNNGTGVVGASHGGAGTVSGLLKADGAGNVSAAGAGTDYVAPAGAGTVPAGTSQYDQLVWNGSAWAVQRPKYVFGFNVPGVLALNTVFSHVFTKAVTIPANFGSYLGHGTQVRGSANATSSPVITVAKAVAGSPLSFSTVGTITITSGGVVPVLATSGGAALSFAQGDIARFLVTTGDTTFADLTATVVGMET